MNGRVHEYEHLQQHSRDSIEQDLKEILARVYPLISGDSVLISGDRFSGLGQAK